jgi:hypothetical protein
VSQQPFSLHELSRAWQMVMHGEERRPAGTGPQAATQFFCSLLQRTGSARAVAASNNVTVIQSRNFFI